MSLFRGRLIRKVPGKFVFSSLYFRVHLRRLQSAPAPVWLKLLPETVFYEFLKEFLKWIVKKFKDLFKKWSVILICVNESGVFEWDLLNA